MMQDFKAECTINLYVVGYGRPEKFVWSYSLQSAKNRWVIASGFVGARERALAEGQVAIYALRQALRLRQEKVCLSADFTVGGIDSTRGRGTQELQLLYKEVAELWSRFRLRKRMVLSTKEKELLASYAKRGLGRGE